MSEFEVTSYTVEPVEGDDQIAITIHASDGNKWEYGVPFSRDTGRYLSHYSKRFKSGDQNFDEFSNQKKQVNAGKEWIKVKVSNLSVFRNPGKEEVAVVTFDQDYRSNNLDNQMKKRQYWLREDGKWKIIYEGSA